MRLKIRSGRPGFFPRLLERLSKVRNSSKLHTIIESSLVEFLLSLNLPLGSRFGVSFTPSGLCLGLKLRDELSRWRARKVVAPYPPQPQPSPPLH